MAHGSCNDCGNARAECECIHPCDELEEVENEEDPIEDIPELQTVHLQHSLR